MKPEESQATPWRELGPMPRVRVTIARAQPFRARVELCARCNGASPADALNAQGVCPRCRPRGRRKPRDTTTRTATRNQDRQP